MNWVTVVVPKRPPMTSGSADIVVVASAMSAASKMINDPHMLPAASSLVAGDPVPGADGVWSEAVEDGPIQQHLQLASVDGVLGPVVSGGTSSTLRPHDVAAPPGERPFVGFDADAVEVVGEPQVEQLANGVGLQVDSDSEWGDPPVRFEDRGIDTDLMTCQRHRQPGNAASGDQHSHDGGRSWLRPRVR